MIDCTITNRSISNSIYCILRNQTCYKGYHRLGRNQILEMRVQTSIQCVYKYIYILLGNKTNATTQHVHISPSSVPLEENPLKSNLNGRRP